MASSARIEELEKKFNENPRRYFAPLANEYRKAGDLDQAIAICRTYVPQQPAHMSGHIVFGQALFEAGEHEEARAVFEAALALDPENLIALRHLGDISRERAELSAARTWYQRVLDADPRNDDVVALLASLDAPVGRDGATNLASWAEINPERTLELPPGLLDSISRDTVLGDPQVVPGPTAPKASGARPIHAFEQTLQPPPPGLPRAGWPRDTPVLAEEIPASAMVDYGSSGHTPSHAGQPPTETPAPVEDVMALASDYAYAPEEQGEPASEQPALGFEPMEFVAPPRIATPAPSSLVSDLDYGQGPAVDETPAAFVTETMAELYLQQGFRDEALSVYRQLLAQSPTDATLRERVDQLEHGARSSVAAASGVYDAAVSAAEGRHADVGRRTVRAFFADLATRRVDEAAWSGPPSVHTESSGEGATESGIESGTLSGAEVEAAAALQAPADAEFPSIPPGESASPAAEAAAPTVSVADLRGDLPDDDMLGSPATVAGGPSADAAPDSMDVSPQVPSGVADAEPSAASGGAVWQPEASATGKADARSVESGDLQVEHIASADFPDAGPLDATILASFSYGAGATIAAMDTAEYDVVSYDSADMAGGLPPGGLPASNPDAVAPPSATSMPASEVGAPSAAPTPPSVDSSEINGAVSAIPVVPEVAAVPAVPAAQSRKAMQTGSVNVLFPQQQVTPADETAAATLSGAFGGPTQVGAPSAGHPARAAVNELSLDSIFRESPPPSEPRRESSAFSFDQFFTGPPNPGAASAPGPAGTTPGGESQGADGPDSLATDAEQFSNWLAGLKKK